MQNSEVDNKLRGRGKSWGEGYSCRFKKGSASQNMFVFERIWSKDVANRLWATAVDRTCFILGVVPYPYSFNSHVRQ